jgi:hypothetical protein
MATKHGEKSNVPVDASAGWEKRDVNIKGLFIFAFWMAVVLVVTMIGMRFTFAGYKRLMPLGPTMSPMVQEGARMIPPKPLLQVQPHQELEDYCAAQQQDMNTYAWVSQSSGVVRIPVDRAMELILAKGLPARPAADATASGSSAGASSAVTTPSVAGETDMEGQCGYLTEPTEADKEREAAEAAEAK